METPPNEAWKRIETVMKISGEKTVNAFAKRIGLLRPELLYRVRSGKNGISKSLANRINNHFPQCDVSWLTCGGDRLLEYLKLNVSNRLVIIPFYADINLFETERYIYLPDSLTRGAEIAVVVKDKIFSTYPHSGSVLLLKRIERVVDFGKIYLVRTDTWGALCKVKPEINAGKLSIMPVVKDTGGKTIDPDSVIEIYEICGIFIV